MSRCIPKLRPCSNAEFTQTSIFQLVLPAVNQPHWNTYRWRSIFFCSLYFLRSLLRTRIRFIHITFSGIRALAVPCLLPNPLCRPFRLASKLARVLARLCTIWGFLIIKPSLISFLMFWREFALAISDDSLGSNQIFFRPHLSTLAASLFWTRKLLK